MKRVVKQVKKVLCLVLFALISIKNYACTPSASTNVQNACDSFFWGAKNKWYYSNNNTDTIKLRNVAGCDSIITLQLTIRKSTHNVYNQFACASFVWNGTTYTSSGTYVYNYVNASGCASADTLKLNILSNINSINILQSGAYCADTVVARLTTNIGAANFSNLTYSWSKLDFNSDTWVNNFSTDSFINVRDANPTQYAVGVNVPGCGTFYSNQKTVLPVSSPNISLNPSAITSICANNAITFNAASTSNNISNFAFYQNNILQQVNTSASYTSPVLNTSNQGDVFRVTTAFNLPNFDGNINEPFWGKPLAVSTGGATPGFGAGHELNALYARADNKNLYIAIAGNVQNNNRIMVFIDSKSGGYVNGNYGRNGLLFQGIKNFNSSSTFDAGFAADYCLGIGTDNTRSNFYFDLFTLSGNANNTSSGGPNNYLGTNNLPTVGYSIGANPANNSSTRGFELAIPLSSIGYSNGDVRLFLMYSSDDGTLSNQFLTKAASGEGNYGNGAINFGAAKPGPIAIPIETLQPGCIASASTTVQIKNARSSTTSATICSNLLPYTWRGKQITQSGVYRDTTTATNGCDSIITLNLTVLSTTNNVFYRTGCNSFRWNGTTYTTSGKYVFNYNNANGCSSTDTLYLTIKQIAPVINNISLSGCTSVTYNNRTYTSSRIVRDTVRTAEGCDSIYNVVNISVSALIQAQLVNAQNTYNTCNIGTVNTIGFSPAGGVFTLSTPGIIALNSSPGSFTTLRGGSTSLTYTVVNGACTSSVSRVIVVDTLANITAPTVICQSQNTTLTHPVSGGSWQLLSGTANLDSATGVLNVNHANPFTIRYSRVNASGCIVRTNPIVLQAVASIPNLIKNSASSFNTCNLNTIVKLDTFNVAGIAPGVWSIADTSILQATANFAEFITKKGGTTTVRYSVNNNGCSTTFSRSVVIDTLPNIATPTAVCQGQPVNLSIAANGGAWQLISGNATLNTSTGAVTVFNTNPVFVRYVKTNSFGCVVRSLPITLQAVALNNPIVNAVATFNTCNVGVTSRLDTANFYLVTGGTWSSTDSNVVRPTNNSGGFITVGGGTAQLQYSISRGGCTSVFGRTIFVDTLPNISGSTTVCRGITSTYTNPVSGGSWQVISGVGSINSNTGVYLSNSIGRSQVRYVRTNSRGCVVRTQPVTINISNCTSSSKEIPPQTIYDQNVITITPNPAQTSIRVSLHNASGKGMYRITDGMGKTYIQQPVQGTTSNIDVSRLARGVYFISLISDKGVSTQTFIKE